MADSGSLTRPSSRELTPVERRPLRGEGARPRVRTTKGCRMTERMRKALQDAQKHPIRRIHDVEHGQPPWPAPSASLNALVRRGYLERTVLKTNAGVVQDVWSITELGKAALSTHWAPEDVDEYVAVGGGYTRDHSRAVDRDPRMGALPRLDADRLSVRWKRQSAEEFMAAKDRKAVARRLARELRAA